jgi:hypothetical protein
MAKIAYDVMTSLKWPEYLKRKKISVDIEINKIISKTIQTI